MPKYDGTGPKGFGPMTGRGLGFCMLRIPRDESEPVTGYAGESGHPVRFLRGENEPKARRSLIDVQQRRLEEETLP